MKLAVVARWGSVLAYMALIWVLSSEPRLSTVIRLPFPHADKLIHLAEFGFLALLLCRALWVGRRHGRALGRAVLAIVWTSSYGILDEWHQSFVLNRVASVSDAIFDCLGACIVVLVWVSLVVPRLEARMGES